MTRVEHAYAGSDDRCKRCWLPPERHRKRVRNKRPKVPPQSLKASATWEDDVVGIDGEGLTMRASHRYVYLSASTERGEKLGSVSNPLGLSTRQCLDFLLSLRYKNGAPISRAFAFFAGYDFAMILRDLPADAMGLLMRPELRLSRGGGHKAVTWRDPDEPSRGRYRINYLRNLWTMRLEQWDADAKPKGRKRKRGAYVVRAKVAVWDVGECFGTSFVRALSDYDVTDSATLARIEAMKVKRSTFKASDMPEIRRYCDDETVLIAHLVRKYKVSNDRAGIPLTAYHSPGSAAAALLRKFGVRHFRADPPAEMELDVRRAFFGGRFELSRVGNVGGPVYSADVAACFPAVMHSLPCLTCGNWERVRGRDLWSRIERARMALVYCRVNQSDKARGDWGPLPWRSADGSIVFPRGGAETWVWREEYMEAARHFSQVEAVDAWVYDSECDCQPFRFLAELYRERLASATAEHTIKLASASVWGKVAQSVGKPQCRSIVWAGVATSRARAMLLSAFRCVPQPWGIVEFATDSVFATRPLVGLPGIADTGTEDLKKSLGSWEHRTFRDGAFFCRPGVRFAENEADVDVRARGFARADFARHAERIREHFAKTWQRDNDGHWFAPPYEINDAKPHFVGMKTATMRTESGWQKSDTFGQWVTSTAQVTFDAEPKRAGSLRNGRLVLRSVRGPSAPYDQDTRGPLAVVSREQSEGAREQPDGGH